MVMKPWKQFTNLSSFTLIYSSGEPLFRLSRNLPYFFTNYTLLTLLIIFLSLLYHPISLLIFLLTFLFWYVLYFDRDAPLVLFDRTISDRVVAVGLFVVTVLAVGFNGVWLNVGVSVGVSAVVVVLHGVFRSVEDLYLDEDMMCGNGVLVSFVGSPTKVNHVDYGPI